MTLIDVFAKREPSTDPVLLKYAPGSKRTDVVIYKDPACTEIKARIPWHYKGCPRRTSKTVMLNCYRWNLNWIN